MHATRTGGPQSALPRRLLALPPHQQQATPPVPLPAPAAPSRCTRPTPVAPPRCTPPMPAAPSRCTPPTNHRPCNERRLWQSKPAINVFRYRKSYIIVFRCSDFCHKRRSLHGGWLEHAINVFRYRKSYITVVRYSDSCHKRHSLHRRPTKRHKRIGCMGRLRRAANAIGCMGRLGRATNVIRYISSDQSPSQPIAPRR